MSPRFTSGQLADLHHHTQQLVEGLVIQEGQLHAFVAAAERDVRQAETAVSRADSAGGDTVRAMLCAHLERSVAGVAMARRLCVGAREQYASAQRLLMYLAPDPGASEEYSHVVLVVDDHGDVRDLLALVLQDAGFVVRTAANGLEGLIAANEMRPDVIVMDVSMPVLDGIEATRLIKASQATRDARVIAHTGNPPLDPALSRTLFAAVLQKPTMPEVVVATVQRVAGL